MSWSNPIKKGAAAEPRRASAAGEAAGKAERRTSRRWGMSKSPKRARAPPKDWRCVLSPAQPVDARYHALA